MKKVISIAFLALSMQSMIGQVWFEAIKDKKLLRFEYHTIGSLLHKARNEALQKYSNTTHKFLITDDVNLALPDFERKSSIEEVDEGLIPGSLFIVYFHTDDDYFPALKKISDNRGIYYSLPYYGAKTRYLWVDKCALQAVDNAFSFGTQISHQNVDVHETICQCLHMTKNLPGDYVEIGVYKGGSALTALGYMKYAGIERSAYFLDTFNGMTYEEAYQSSDALWQGTHVLWGVDQTMQHIAGVLATTGKKFTLVPSNICADQLPTAIKQIAVCNIDVDLYDATIMALHKVAPLMVKGGIIICEDPTSTPTLGGALLAMEEFLATVMGKKFIKILAGAQYLLIKIEN